MIGDKQFITKLRKSLPGVLVVAGWHIAGGKNVKVPGIHVRPNRDLIKEFVDEGDLFVETRWEVKSTRYEWTSRQDFKLPQVLICDKHAHDSCKRTPDYYALLNQAKTHAIVVAVARTRHLWWSEVKHNGESGEEQEFYFCPLDCVQWHELPWVPEQVES